MSDDLSGFDAKAETSIDPDQLSMDFDRFYHNVLPHLFPTQARQLITRIGTLELIPAAEAVDGQIEYGANYDITIEVEGLIQSVRAMRNTVMTPEGNVREGIAPREMKEMITATTSLMNLLMKSHEKLMTFDRHRALEQATVDVLRQLGGEEIVGQFVEMMEGRLEK